MERGGDFKGFISSVFGKGKKRTNKLDKYIKRYGHKTIDRIEVCRVPIQKGLQIALNLFTLGKWEKEKDKLPYDDVFHLYLILYLGKNGHLIIRIELNQRLTIEEIKDKPKGECIPVPIQSDTITFSTFISRSERDYKDIYHYDLSKNNCQIYVTKVLKSNGLLTPELYEFIKQDTDKLVSPALKKIGNKLVDVAALYDTIRE